MQPPSSLSLLSEFRVILAASPALKVRVEPLRAVEEATAATGSALCSIPMQRAEFWPQGWVSGTVDSSRRDTAGLLGPSRSLLCGPWGLEN